MSNNALDMAELITIAPPRPKGKYLVARKGSGKTYYIVAECHSEDNALRITFALNTLQAANDKTVLKAAA